jgi:hypothetical protein
MSDVSKYIGYWSYNHDETAPESSIYIWKSKRPNVFHRMMNMLLLGNVWFDATPQPIEVQELPQLEFKPICPECENCEEQQSQEPDGYIVETDDDEEPRAIFKDPWQ